MANLISKLFKSDKVKTIPNYQNWRNGIFTATPEIVGVSKDIPDYVYAVIMDVGLAYDDGRRPVKKNLVISVTALASGESTLMPTWAGGLIGLGSFEEISTLAKQIIDEVQPLFSTSKPASDHNYLPVSGLVCFYFLTTSGLRIYECKLQDLYSDKHPFAQIFALFDKIKNLADELNEKYKNVKPENSA